MKRTPSKTDAEAKARVLRRFKEEYGDLDADAIEALIKRQLNTITISGTAYPLDTEEFANRNNVKSHTVISRLCRTGSYFGVVPRTLANRRHAWPDVQVARK